MNLPLLSADIVRRVQHSQDSAHNLACVVANLIREEMETGACEEHKQRMERLRTAYGDTGGRLSREQLRREFDRDFWPG